MKLEKFEVCSSDAAKPESLQLSITYQSFEKNIFGIWFYHCPREILDDIGAKELASRIYSVFKQHISRPASE